MSNRYSFRNDQPRPVSFDGKRVPSIERYVRIERDYSHGELCQFNVEFPPILAGRIEKSIFLDTLTLINQHLYDAEKISFVNCIEIVLSFVSLYTLDCCYVTTYERKLNKLSELIKEQNRIIYEPKGLHINDPRENAFLFLEICVQE
ncbi:hypothetical protein H8356DRAFT_1697054 [Neocallimastix lanati (nom. inval.)]|jgi:hypothetical protein|uniref:Ras modification protein ERF4 n=1 Tax=Neocallimastix californiae TaxID=1754190 RepID=A0A1Y2BZ67_9FUNG|nr:hypothetical protein H8356DRAFT_1697054 [Neocallimastix sp. JGI-2020a]ORY40059.1 hypothetical protein LY90DRAFT_672292 [Neocallimastix californiae]|eukprot:ORY40059.1 hypothetical protein LY90DRAFT_672292 [Neocallimastix californiae]